MIFLLKHLIIIDGLSLNSQLSVRMFEELAVSPTVTTQLLTHTEYGVRSKISVFFKININQNIHDDYA